MKENILCLIEPYLSAITVFDIEHYNSSQLFNANLNRLYALECLKINKKGILDKEEMQLANERARLQISEMKTSELDRPKKRIKI